MGGYNANWDYRTPFDSQNAKVLEAVSNGYLDLSEFATAEFWDNVKDGGGDIRLTKANGSTEVAREVVSCDTATETGEVHFDTTGILTGSDIGWNLYYGNAAADDYAIDAEFGAEAVWDANYKMVQHLKDETTASTLDSTAEDNDGTKLAANTPLGVAGAIGMAQDFEHDADHYIHIGAGTSLSINGDLTAEFIIKPETFGAWENQLMVDWAAGARNFYFRFDGDSPDFVTGNGGAANSDPLTSTTNLTPGNTYWLAFVRSGTDIYIYLQGAEDCTKASVMTGGATGNDINLGTDSIHTAGHQFDGIIDEMRMSASARSEDWLATIFNNQSDPATFWSIGTEEANPGPTVGPPLGSMSLLGAGR